MALTNQKADQAVVCNSCQALSALSSVTPEGDCVTTACCQTQSVAQASAWLTVAAMLWWRR